MIGWFNRVLAKSSFDAVRAAVYKNLADEMTEKGAARTELLPDKFDRWAKRDKKRGEMAWLAYATISKRLRSGASLSKALGGFIPREEQLVIAAGEDTPRLADVLESLVSQMDMMKDVRAAMSGALLEPVVMLLGFFGMSILFGKMVWPPLESAFKSQYWDAWTTPMRSGQLWFSSWWLACTIVLFVFVFAVYASRPVWTGRARRFFDNVPPFSIYRDLSAIQSLVMLAALSRAGKKLSESFEIIAKTAPPYLRWHMKAMRKRLNQPRSTIDYVISTGLFQRLLVDLIADAAQRHEVDKVFERVATNKMKAIVSGIAFKARLMNMIGMVVVYALLGYSSAVQVIGVQNAGDRAMAAQQSNKR